MSIIERDSKQKNASENIDWPSILSGMFTDPRFRKFDKWCWYGEVEGKKVGVVLATINPGYDNFALNKNDTDRLLAAKRDGQLDEAFLVGASVDASNTPTYCDSKDAETFYEEELKKLRPRPGRYGEFWMLTQFTDNRPF
jgi:hypothetical protein